MFVISLSSCLRTLIHFLSDFFFSRFEKYVVFFSLCSTYCAFDLIIIPFILKSIMSFRSFLLKSKLVFNISSEFSFNAFSISFSISLISKSSSFSLVFCVFFLCEEYFIVSFLIVPYINSHKIFGLALLLISTI